MVLVGAGIDGPRVRKEDERPVQTDNMREGVNSKFVCAPPEGTGGGGRAGGPDGGGPVGGGPDGGGPDGGGGRVGGRTDDDPGGTGKVHTRN